MKEQFSRKHFLILPSYQLRLVGFLAVFLFIGSIIHGFFLYSITAKSVEDGFLSAHNRLRSTWEILKPAIILTNGVSFCLLTLVFFVAGILISHRLIGPLFKITRRIREMSLGKLDFPPVKLRKGDEGQSLSDAVNRLQDSVRDRFKVIRELKRQWDNGYKPPETEIKSAIENALKNLELGD